MVRGIAHKATESFMFQNDNCKESNVAACAFCLKVAEQMAARMTVLSMSSFRWNKYSVELKSLIDRMQLHMKWKCFSSLAPLGLRLCVLANQINHFNQSLAFEMDLLAADLFFYACHREVQAADALYLAAHKIYNIDEGRATLILGKASDIYERNGYYCKALQTEQLSLYWQSKQNSQLAGRQTLLRLRCERVEYLDRLCKLESSRMTLE